MQELIAFAHGMANFSHLRVKKKDQEMLICKHLGRHSFRGAFDDSGNFAFLTPHGLDALQADILTVLNRHFKDKNQVEGVVVIDRNRVEKALSDLENIVTGKYGEAFQRDDYTVWKGRSRWKLGFVFLNLGTGLNQVSTSKLCGFQNAHMKVLSIQGDIVGVLKFDPKKPRIPWGVLSRDVARVVGGGASSLIATSRSARTVRGVLHVFQKFHVLEAI